MKAGIVTGLLALAACSEGSEPGSAILVSTLRAGVNSTCTSLEEDGAALCWGANEFSQIDGSTTDRLRPTRVTGAPLFSTPFPGNHFCAIDPGGLYCWGLNTSGQVGNGTTDPVPAPALVTGGLVFQQVAIGEDFTCGLANSGLTYCWGANDFGQLGTGIPGDSPSPVAVAGDPQFRVIAAGGRTACGATAAGELLCWGNGFSGELGDGQFGSSTATPTAVTGGHLFVDVAIGANGAGEATVCASTDTVTYCWGKNTDGEIGDGTTLPRNLPTAVIGIGGSQVAPGGSHTCARVVSAAVFCWGKGGRLGTGNSQPSLTPVAVSGGLVFSAVSSGREHTCGKADEDASRAYCWGDNSRGQLGNGGRSARLAPTRIQF